MSNINRRCDFFKKLLKAIVKVLVIIAIIIIVIAAIVLSGGTALAALIPLGLTAVQFLMVGLGLLALGFMLDKDTASQTLGSAVSGIKEAVGSVVNGVIDVAGDATKSLFSNFLWLIPIGIGGYLLWDNLTSEDRKDYNRRENAIKTMD